MSYMGVKQHCLDLQRDGYLDTWRNPKPIGRPEMLYRLTRKSHELFPVQSHEMLLQVLAAARQLFGPTAPAKLLFVHFREKTEAYRTRLRGETIEDRAKWFARLRDREGCMTELFGRPAAAHRRTPQPDRGFVHHLSRGRGYGAGTFRTRPWSESAARGEDDRRSL